MLELRVSFLCVGSMLSNVYISDLQGPEIVEMGIDLSEFYKSVEWDILGVPAARFFIIYFLLDIINVNL